MKYIREFVYRMGWQPKPGSIFYSPTRTFMTMGVVDHFVKGLTGEEIRLEGWRATRFGYFIAWLFRIHYPRAHHQEHDCWCTAWAEQQKTNERIRVNGIPRSTFWDILDEDEEVASVDLDSQGDYLAADLFDRLDQSQLKIDKIRSQFWNEKDSEDD